MNILPQSTSIFRTDTLEGIGAVIIFFLISLLCFGLSYKDYDKDDVTPVATKVGSALLAAAWNIVYLIYYFISKALGI